MDADYVIVGAGAAGCVLASRLTADPAVRVVVVEVGGPGRDPLLRIPKGFYLTMQRAAHTHRYVTESGEWWLRGKGLGGSTAINGMMWIRGWAPDYDALGDPHWRWAQMLAAFRALEDHELGSADVRGCGGPVHVAVPRRADRVVDAMLAAAAAIGLHAVDDVNSEDGERIGPAPSTIRRGLRVDAASAFLRPARRRRNLRVLTGVRAEHLIIEQGRAVGVAVRRGGRRLVLRAGREVLLSAGAIESPLLLERSGIGHPRVLSRAGVPLKVASPNVGERLLEHRGLTLQARLRPGLGLNRRLGSIGGRLLAGAGYLATRRGPVATGPYDLIGQLRSAPDEARPDVQVLLTPMSLDPDADRLRLADHAGLMIQGYQLRPTSRSSIHLRSSRPEEPPRIEFHCLRSDLDRRVTERILDRLRVLLAAAPLADLVLGETAPGAQVSTPEQAVEHSRLAGGGIYHAVGSCAMGPDDVDVVDLTLRVRGLDGLRVVDASVFPALPSGNTAAPTMALAWRAADLLLEDR